MSFPFTDYLCLQKSGLLEVCYQGNPFIICRVAKWAYMSIVITEDTTEDEYEESRVSFAGWLIDYEFARKIIDNNSLFAATVRNQQTGREPDLVVTITSEQNPLEKIRNEVETGIRKPIEDPKLDRFFKEQETKRLKVFLDKYGETPQFSPKKVWHGMLMLLLYPFGLPFFYFNKPLWGGIMLGFFVISLLLPILLIPAGLLGCVFIVMTLIHVLGNKAKDKNGLWICTKRDQRIILESIATYKKNSKELQGDGGES